MTATLITEDRIPLVALASELGVDRKTVARWVDQGYGDKRLESYRIGKKRYSTRQAAARFLAAVNGESNPCAATAVYSLPVR
jgi:hypothetical protein